MGRGLQLRFEVVGRAIVEDGLAALDVVACPVEADLKRGFGQARKATVVGQFGLEAVPKGPGAGIVVAVAAPAHAGHGPVAGEQGFETGGRELAALVGMHNEPGRWAAQV